MLYNESSKPNPSELESNTIHFEKSPYGLLFTDVEINGQKVKGLKLVQELLSQNKLIPVLDRVYLFHPIQSAHRYVDTGRKRGNVVLKVNI